MFRILKEKHNKGEKEYFEKINNLSIELTPFTTQTCPTYEDFGEVMGFVLRKKQNIDNIAARTNEEELEKLEISNEILDEFRKKRKSNLRIDIDNELLKKICNELDIFYSKEFILESEKFYKFIFPKGKNSLDKRPGKIKKMSEFLYEYFSLENVFDKIQENEEVNPFYQVVAEIYEEVLETKGYIKKQKEKEKEKDVIFFFLNIRELFEKDVESLSKYKKYFRNNFELLLHYYSFFYFSSLVNSINRGKNINEDKQKGIYFILEKETPRNWRKNYRESSVKRLFGDKPEKLYLFSYLLKFLKNEFNELENQELAEKFMEINESKENLDLLEEIYWNNCLKQSSYKTNKQKYSTDFINICNRFTKNAGQLGKIFIISNDLLLLLTNIIASQKKESELLLSEYFIELEKRGIFFDENTKEEVEKILTKTNLIKKSSDSGEMKYVESIL